MFVESGGGRIGIVAVGQGAVDGGGGTGKGQTKKIVTIQPFVLFLAGLVVFS